MEYVVMAAGTFAGVLVYHILADIYKRCKRRKAEKEWRREARKFREHDIGAEEDERCSYLIKTATMCTTRITL